MSDQLSNPSPEVAKEKSLVNFDQLTKNLLSDPEINNLDPAVQGDVIVDRFIGALARQGSIEGSQTSYSPGDVLFLMDGIKQPEDIAKITRTDGLKEAALSLGGDPRTARLFGSLEGRLIEDQTDPSKLTLTSAAQVEGYILAGGAKNSIEGARGGVEMEGEQWIGVLMERMEGAFDAKSPYEWITDNGYSMSRSDIDYVRKSGNDWAMAARSAEKAGVDMNLLTRTAERAKLRTTAGGDLGHAAAMLATKGRIESYKATVSRRQKFNDK